MSDGTPAHSFRTLLEELSTIVRNTCRTTDSAHAPTFTIVTQAKATQQRALKLLETMTLYELLLWILRAPRGRHGLPASR